MFALIGSMVYLFLSSATVYAATVDPKLNKLNSYNQNNYSQIAALSNNTADPANTGASDLVMDDNDAKIILTVLIAAFFFLGLLFGIIFGFLLETYKKKNRVVEKKYHNYYRVTEKCYNKKPFNLSSYFDSEKNPDIIKYHKAE
jgi:hypothetical protein